jgi:hypothetical protein
VASLDLDTPSQRTVNGAPVTLRWILFRLIEETARHNGHLDILREMADGVTGSLAVQITRPPTTPWRGHRGRGRRPSDTPLGQAKTALRCM